MIVDKCMEIFFFLSIALSYDEVIAKQRFDIEEQLTVNPK